MRNLDNVWTMKADPSWTMRVSEHISEIERLKNVMSECSGNRHVFASDDAEACTCAKATRAVPKCDCCGRVL